jgi:predicted porin
MISTSLIERAAIVGLACIIFATVNPPSLKAADLGGDCCADLEERVAELEATTVRKGNRKVSVTISGQIHKALLVWDDGEEGDAYVVDPTVWSTYLAVTGEGEVSNHITIGYELSIEPIDAASIDVTQNDGDDGDNRVEPDNVNVFVEDERLGRLTIGNASEAHDGVTQADVSGSGLVAGPAVTDWNGGFSLVLAGSGELIDVTWVDASAGDVGDGSTRSVVRYNTPDWNGLVLALSWGEDDILGVSARYETEAHGFKLASAVGFGDEADDDSPCTVDDLTEAGKCRTLAGSVSVLHLATGFSGTVAAGTIDDDNRRRFFPSLDGSDAWIYGKAGLVRNYFGIGGTAIYGEYYHSDRGVERTIDAASAGTPLPFVTSEIETEVWGVGLVQEIKALGIEAYASYRNYQAEIDGAAGAAPATLAVKDFDAVLVGMRVPF